MVEQHEYEVIYWPGKFGGRGEYIRVLLELAGKKYRDVGTEEDGEDQVCGLMEGKTETPYPVLFPPYLRHNGTIINQLPAIMLYVG